MAVRIEDAGFEIRDMIAWVYWSWFPKSLNVGKSINSIETKEWSNIWKALDIVSEKDILQVWKNNSSNVSIVETQSLKNQIIAGQDMPREISVQANVAEENNQENWNLIVDFVVKNLQEAQALLPETNTVLMNVDAEIKQKQDLAKFVEQSLQNLNHKYLNISIAEWNANELQKEKTSEIIKVEEALMTLRGNKKYWNNEVINALCVALTENLKLTILNQSKTFQSLDTKSQIECVSAINVTITEYTAECLISSTVDIAKKIAIDKLQGNEREVTRVRTDGNKGGGANTYDDDSYVWDKPFEETKWTSEREWRWTALKPALEPITVARKPLDKGLTVAENCLKWGVGGINIDESRVGTEDELKTQKAKGSNGGEAYGDYNLNATYTPSTLGRFPANLIHDNSEEVRECFPDTNPSRKAMRGARPKSPAMVGDRNYVEMSDEPRGIDDNGGNASRFFKSIIYQAKASKSERNMWCEELPLGDPPASARSKPAVGRENALGNPRANNHPTVKPIALMEYLVKLVSKEWGIVLDPFAWSGSTLIACKRIDRQYIGIEMTEEYIPIIEARLNAVVKEEPEEDLQPSLF